MDECNCCGKIIGNPKANLWDGYPIYSAAVTGKTEILNLFLECDRFDINTLIGDPLSTVLVKLCTEDKSIV